MPRLIPYAIILLLIGVIIGLNVQPTPSPPLTVPLSSDNIGAPYNKHNAELTQQLTAQFTLLQNRVKDLEQDLTGEREKNSNILSQLTLLQKNITELNEISSDKSTDDEPSLSHVNDGLKIPDVTAPRLTQAQRNKKVLLTIGVGDDNALRIQRLSEKKEMDQLYLRNTAAREGWFGTEKYFEKTRELDLSSNIYREELGDDKYDLFLYSSQLANRITVQSVLSGSPAENSGLQSGDYILSYDNQRVFNWSDLTSLTANGEAGENVEIEIQRNGQVFQYFIERGPLGIRLSSERIDPNPS